MHFNDGFFKTTAILPGMGWREGTKKIMNIVKIPMYKPRVRPTQHYTILAV